MSRSTMSLLRDPSLVHAQLNRRRKIQKSRFSSSGSSHPSSLGERVSLTALASLVRDSVTWVGDVLNTYWDGLLMREREKAFTLIENRQALYLKMRNSRSYKEWRRFAYELDEVEGNSAWKESFESDEYNPRLVLERLKQLEEARNSRDISRILHLIRTTLCRDLGNMSDARLYRHSHVGTKNLIDQYINTALSTISTLIDLSGSDRCDASEMEYILEQLLLARQAFGRSAMLFSGGATLGMNHIGVIKALWEAKLLPRIVSGASAGSIICAVFCVHTDDELPAVLETFAYGDFSVFEAEGQEETMLQRAARFLKYGCFYDISHLERAMREWLGNMTFQEAYNRTRRILNICISSAGLYELPCLLNYITSPNVMIWSAVVVSCSVPVVFAPSVLMAKDPLTGEAVPWHGDRQWIDGSVDGDLPMTRLAEMFNVNHFIVSQVNPHVVPFLPKEDGPGRDNRGRSSVMNLPWMQTFTSLATEEALHRMTVLSELGIFPNELTKAASILSQKYSGDINILPEILYANFPRMLKNPTPDFMLQACLNGQRATWPKIARVRNHVAIELALDSAVQTMRARVTLDPCPIEFGMNAINDIFNETIDSSQTKPDLFSRRRSSYSHESERPEPRRSKSKCRLTVQLRKAHSTVSMDHLKHYLSAPSALPNSCKEQTRGSGPIEWPSLNGSGYTSVSDSEREFELSPQRRSLAFEPFHWGPVSPVLPSAHSTKQGPEKYRHTANKTISLPPRSPVTKVIPSTNYPLIKLTRVMDAAMLEGRHLETAQ